MTRRRGHEFSAEETAELLTELDARLRHRGVAAAIFVVGGAAIAATGVRSGRLTEGVDALSRDTVVLDEAKTLGRERGLPETWLNLNANMWMPPLPSGVLDPPAEPGLRVIYADDGFLFATKLIAQRQGRGRCQRSRRTTWARDRDSRAARGPHPQLLHRCGGPGVHRQRQGRQPGDHLPCARRLTHAQQDRHRARR